VGVRPARAKPILEPQDRLMAGGSRGAISRGLRERLR